MCKMSKVSTNGGSLKETYSINFKCILSILLIIGLCLSSFPITISADPSLINMASDSFTAADGTYLVNYAGGTGFTSTWKADSALTTNLPSTEYYIMNNRMTTVNSIKWGGLSGQAIGMYRGLNQAIDFNTDKDYYIQFKMTARNFGGDTYQNLNFGGKFNVGYKRNDSLGQVYPCTTFTGTNVSASSNLVSGTEYTFVVYIRARTGVYDTLKFKVFDNTQTPTYTPSSWDVTVAMNRMDSATYIGMQFKNGSGSGAYPTFDEPSINADTQDPNYTSIGTDSFTAADSTYLVNYTGGTGFTDKWKADSALTTDIPSTEFYIMNNRMTTVNPIKWGGLSGQVISMYRGLNQAINFNVDQDYYIQFKMTARNYGGDTYQILNFGGKFSAGYKRNDSLGQVYPYTSFTGSGSSAANNLVSGTEYTFVIYISAKASGNDTLYLKTFDNTQTPTYTPDSWDLTVTSNRTDSASYAGMTFKNGSGSGTYPTFDELIMNKRAPQPVLTYFRGVNIAGAEFNASTLPGVAETNFTWNNEATYNYFGNKGLNIIRVPILWERIQPTLNAALDTTYLNGLKNNITWAKNHNAKVIIDVHNYGRYRGGVIGVDANVPISAFTDLWVRLSNEFKNESGVYAYDIMNEPHGMGTGANDWKVISQTVLTTIRNNSDNKLIMIEGNSYANAGGWESKNGSATSWITDSANNFMYSAHCYFDSNASGTYTQTYDQELAANPNLATVGVTRVMDFITWCNNNNVKGYIGEFGVPSSDSRWNTVLENFMNTLDQYGISSTYWAGGTWWGSYPLSVQPTNNYTTDAPQMSILLNHLAQ